MGKLSRRIHWIYNRQWDYQYIHNILKYEVNNIENVFIGSSYVVFGLNRIDNSVVLALPSQDIYYSVALLKKYLSSKNATSVKRVILGVGYYTLYHDLSRTKSSDENNRILDIYFPLLNDLHNMPYELFVNIKKKFGIVNGIIKICVNKFAFRKGQEQYFEDMRHSRIDKARVTWSDKSTLWSDLSEKERIQAAQVRSNAHSRLFKHEDTKLENIEGLIGIHSQCSQKGIKFYIFLAPMSDEYMKSLSSVYKDKIPEIKAILKNYSDGFIDYNNDERIQFTAVDFVDSDHMSDSGAEKFTKIVVEDFL